MESIQLHKLAEILNRNRACEYGKQYGFQYCKDVDQFRRAVPLITFEDVRPYVERMANGEQNQLTNERVLAFFKTSGSMAAPKLIPVTASFLREKSRAFGVYWSMVYQQHPIIKNGRMIANFNDSGGVDRTEGNIEVTSEATFWNRRTQGLHDRAQWPIPPELRQIRDPLHRNYAAARLALQGPLHGIMVLNPSSLLLFCRTLADQWPALLMGIRDGSWGREDEEFLNDIPASLHQHLARSPERTRFLEGHTGEFLNLQQVWPELEQIICWHSEIVQPYLIQLQRYLGDVPGRDYITQSSECIMAIPVQDGSNGGLLAYQSHFFEFIPEQNIEAANPGTVLASELKLDEVYELVVTTGGGLYRYRSGDCVLVTGFQGSVPEIRFLYRAGKTSSMTGEKLTEYQVVDAADRASQRTGFRPREMVCFPRSGANPHYGVLLTWSGDPDWDKTPKALSEIRLWLREFDHELRNVNSEYKDKCASGRLGLIVGLVTSDEGFEHFRRLRKAAKVSDSQIKNDALNKTLDLDASFPIVETVHADSAY